eukprot:scaffold284849_cov28-Tisochrysis_lutea.AAC.3
MRDQDSGFLNTTLQGKGGKRVAPVDAVTEAAFARRVARAKAANRVARNDIGLEPRRIRVGRVGLIHHAVVRLGKGHRREHLWSPATLAYRDDAG